MSDEQQLVARLQVGDEEAFSRFFDQYRNTIYNFGLRFCGNADDASEVLQDTLINTFRYIKNFQGKSKLSTWLYRIASNACLMRRRKNKNGDVSLDQMDEDARPMPGDNSFKPDQLLEQKEMGDIIQDALIALPETYRIPFILKEIEQLPHAEIAEVLDTSVSNAKVRVHRARLMLREKVAERLREKDA